MRGIRGGPHHSASAPGSTRRPRLYRNVVEPGWTTLAAASGALCDDFAVLPHVKRRSIHSRRTPRGFFGANQSPFDACSALRIPIQALTLTLRFHLPDSISFGGRL